MAIEHSLQQQVFDSQYVTASEIMKFLGISRAGFLYARRSGKLPDPIVLNDGRVVMWKRDQVNTILQSWKETIEARKVA